MYSLGLGLACFALGLATASLYLTRTSDDMNYVEYARRKQMWEQLTQDMKNRYKGEKK